MNSRFINKADQLIHSDFTSECTSCINKCSYESFKLICPINNDERRIGKIKSQFGEVFSCTNNSDFVKSSKYFKTIQSVKIVGLQDLEKTKNEINQETKRLIHNLTKTNGHNIQELYAIVPQDLLTQNLQDQLTTIKHFILENPEESAKTFLRIAKNNAAMKTEFSVFKKLFEGSIVLQKKNHPIRKVVLNLFHIFFQDFNDLNVYVNFEENNDYFIFDYESIHVALYHLIDNATKYVIPNSTINVNFKQNPIAFSVILDMISIRIEDNEKFKLLEEGFSGEMARKLNKAGDGIGLARVSQILELNNAELLIRPRVTPSLSSKHLGIWYDQNQFEIRFYK